MKFIALDDEPLALVLIERMAANLPEWELVGTFTDAELAANFLRHNSVDLLISDINMPDISGLEFVRNLPNERPLVIFLTAYKEHAVEGFDLEVVDYLVKPVAPARFARAMGRATELINLRQKAESAPASQEEEYIYVYSEYKELKITLSEILYIESMGDYVKIFLDSQPKPILTLNRLKTLAEELHDKNFRRVHRSFIINLNKIEAKQKSRLLIGGEWIPVSEKYGNALQ
ncbi:MAG: response regulator transcription factor [Bacteroidetes bacterium]|nr:response regulator transcription factor [Bacteroidota bacterium]